MKTSRQAGFRPNGPAVIIGPPLRCRSARHGQRLRSRRGGRRAGSSDASSMPRCGKPCGHPWATPSGAIRGIAHDASTRAPRENCHGSDRSKPCAACSGTGAAAPDPERQAAEDREDVREPRWTDRRRHARRCPAARCRAPEGCARRQGLDTGFPVGQIVTGDSTLAGRACMASSQVKSFGADDRRGGRQTRGCREPLPPAGGGAKRPGRDGHWRR